VAAADLVIVGSFVPDGVEVAEWVLRHAGGAVAFYDIDTPVTLDKLARGDHEYLHPRAIPRFDVYLSFTAGPALVQLSERYGARRPEPFFCFVDPEAYHPVPDSERRWELTYLGTHSTGRQPALNELLVAPAIAEPELRMVVAGPMYPPELVWPPNVERIEHVAPGEHPPFYCSGAWTLNITRPEMRALGHSPSVRLFEASACGVPIISDVWPGIETVLEPGREIVLAEHHGEVLAALGLPEEERRAIGAAARERVLAEHTAAQRVDQLHDLLGVAA
jgi:spore maturation protein CgeB